LHCWKKFWKFCDIRKELLHLSLHWIAGDIAIQNRMKSISKKMRICKEEEKEIERMSKILCGRRFKVLDMDWTYKLASSV